jgi:hypothetical protein
MIKDKPGYSFGKYPLDNDQVSNAKMMNQLLLRPIGIPQI